jgi:nucleoid-associated protein YgaU
MRNRYTFIFTAVLVVAIFGFVGCCRKPPVEVSQAEQALEKAKNEQADVYVPEDYEAAEKKVVRSVAMGDVRKCKQAKEEALAAITLASDVEKSAVEAKNKAKADAEAAIAKAKEAIAKAEKAKAFELLPAVMKQTKDHLGMAEKYAADPAGYNKAKHVAEVAALIADKAVIDAEAVVKLMETEKAKAAEEAKVEAKKEFEEALKAHPLNWVVSKGECLWKISEYEKIYSDPFQWPVIYKANKFQLKDPDLIFPGQSLVIPRNVPQDQIDEAIRFAKRRPWPVPDYLFDGK